MVQIPISDELYEKLEERGREQGLTPDQVATNLLIGVMREVVGDKVRLVLNAPLDLQYNLGELASRNKMTVPEYALKVLDDKVRKVHELSILKEDLGLDDYALTVLDVWFNTVKARALTVLYGLGQGLFKSSK